MLKPLSQAGEMGGWLADNIGFLAIGIALALTYLFNNIKEGDAMIKQNLASSMGIFTNYLISVAANTIPLT